MVALERADRLGDRRLAVGGLVGVNNALGGGLVELAARLVRECGRFDRISSGYGLTDLAYGSLQRRLHSLVADARLFVGAVPLDLRLDVCH